MPDKIKMLCQNLIILNNLSVIGLAQIAWCLSLDPDHSPSITDLRKDGEEWHVNLGDAFWLFCYLLTVFEVACL